MPYPVPPPLPPVVHHVTPNASPAVSPPIAPDAIEPVSSTDLRAEARVDARSLGGAITVELAEPAQPDAQTKPVQTEPSPPEPARRERSIASQFPQEVVAQAETPSPVLPVNPPGTGSSRASIRPVAELDALIAVTQARSTVPRNEPALEVEDFARSGQISPQRPSTAPSTPLPPSVESATANGQSPAEAAAPGSSDSGQVLTIPGQNEAPAVPAGGTGADQRQPANQTPNQAAQTVPEVIELSADRQEYDEQRQVFRAEGNVVMRFRQAILTADRVQVNIPNRLAVADGNAALQRGQQTLRGEQFTYNFGFDRGSVLQARGEVNLGASTDFDANQRPVVGSPLSPAQSVGAQITETQPLQAAGSGGGLIFGVATGGQAAPSQQGATLSRLRFEAEQLQFNGQSWEATNVRLTNDPFSPPELEVRSNRVTVTPLSPTSSEIRARNPRAVFDQGLELPLLIDRAVISQERQNPGLFNIGYDERDRGGFFIERAFNVVSNSIVDFSLTPQILVQRAIEEDGFLSGSSYGLIASLTATPTPTTSIVGNAVFTSLDLGDLEDTFRASLRAQQRIFANHTVAVEYSYRDRLFNGSLGFQNVQSSLGLVITSPVFTLGQTGILLDYQAGVQFINARTDRDSLLREQNVDPQADEEDRRVDLTRYQATVSLSRPILIWAGTPLPATPTEGLRYTPNPVVPYVAVTPSIRGVYSAYSNNETQASVNGSISLSGQFGHFSRPFLDYTAFNISYSRVALSGESPFLFDRVADVQVLSAGITQQIYGPVRFGVQTAYNLDNGDTIDTVFTLEYSRRTYSITAAYSPRREAASIVFRLFDFNWTGDPGPFSGLNSEDNVIDGVQQQ